LKDPVVRDGGVIKDERPGSIYRPALLEHYERSAARCKFGGRRTHLFEIAAQKPPGAVLLRFPLELRK